MEKKKTENLKEIINTKDLEIVYKNLPTNSQEKVLYQLYYSNYKVLVRQLFLTSLERNAEKTVKNSNIWSIIGERGSGKTTAMSGLCNVLKEMEEPDKRNEWIERVLTEPDQKILIKGMDFSFYVLKPIDAGMLDESEDLLELILAKIYQEFSKDIEKENLHVGEEHERQEILEKFEELLYAYRALGKGKVDTDYSAQVMLNLWKSSQEISEQIEQLFERLVLLRKHTYKRESVEYLVVPIDDLDLNLKQGHKMLEQIQKYLHSNKIIVLLTMDYEQIQRVYTEAFHKALSVTDEEDRKQQKHLYSYRLTNDSMIKVFPLNQRLFMPDVKKEAHRNNILVRLENDNCISIKKFLMNKIAGLTGIYYDILGGKLHFCEPTSIRMLVFYNEFLDSLQKVDMRCLQVGYTKTGSQDDSLKQENYEMMELYDQNHRRFNWDITKRLAQIMLVGVQQRVFRELLDFELERRAIYYVKLSYTNENEIHIKDIGTEDRNDYSYDDFLQKIYDGGRSHYDMKAFNSCILASFTSEMVREYVGYCCYKGTEKERCRQRLYKFLGKSFSNNWTGKIIPWGFHKNAPLQAIEIFIPISNYSRMMEIKRIDFFKNELDKWKEGKQLVQMLEIIDMFCIPIKESDRMIGGVTYDMNWDYSVVYDKKYKKYTENPEIKITASGKINFDVMGMVIKSLNYPAQKKRLQENIVSALDSAIGLKISKANDKKHIIETFVEENSIFKEVDRYETVFPFYNVDLAYNVLKRVWNDRKQWIQQEKYVEDEETGRVKMVQDLYRVIQEQLTREDEQYFESGRSYGEIWRNSCYVQGIDKILEMDQKDGFYAARELNTVLGILSGDAWQKMSEPEEPEA